MSARATTPVLAHATSVLLRGVSTFDDVRLRLWDEDNLTVTQLRLLNLLAKREGVGNSVLADGLGLTRPSVSALLARLENAGFLIRDMDRVDRRGIIINLTDKGRQATSPERDIVVAEAHTLVSALSDDEQKTLASLLEKSITRSRNGHGAD